MEAYKKWVRKNRAFVHSLESLANGVTWLIPERFSNSEIVPEAVYAFLGIIGALNEHIIETAPSRGQPKAPAEHSFPLSLCLSMLKDLETVVEVAAQQFCGDDGKWNFIAATEAIKVLVRLALFRDSGYEMLLRGGELMNADKDSKSSESNCDGNGSCGRPGGYFGPGGYQNYRGYEPQNLEGRALSALSRFGENARMVCGPMWSSRPQQTAEFSPAPLVVKPTLSTLWSEKGLSDMVFVIEEVLHITRPLIYVLFIRKYGIQSWRPWLVSFAVDLTAMGILSHVTSSGPGGRKHCFLLSDSEKDEVKRRKLLWALYIMRDPFFSKYARHRLEKTEKYTSQIPFIGFLTGKIVELIIGAQTRYTYTSGS